MKREKKTDRLEFKIGNIAFKAGTSSIQVTGGGLLFSIFDWPLVKSKKSKSLCDYTFQHPLNNSIRANYRIKQTNNGCIIDYSIENTGNHDIWIKHWQPFTNLVFDLGADAQIYSVENCRTSFLNTIWTNPQDLPSERPLEFGTLLTGTKYGEIIAGNELEYGRTEDQAHPARIIVDKSQKQSLVIAPLSNRKADLLLRISGTEIKGKKQTVSMSTELYYRGQEELLIPSGTTEYGETIYIGNAATTDITDALDGYYKLLKKELKTRTSKERLKVFEDGKLWGSWNLGIEWRINDKIMSQQIKNISETRPDLSWIQLDDGYTTCCKPGLFILEPPGIEREKFPKGLKALADEIKAHNLKPALWLSLIVNRAFQLPDFAEDWLLLKKDGTPLTINGGNKFLDFSLQEVRDYFEKVIKTVTKDWGYQGFKFDFWSEHFHCVDLAYKNPEWTGAMLRDWFWQTLRKYVGPEGYLLTCVCAGNGNPFIGQYADAFRCGVDVCEGLDWHGLVSNAFWYGMLAKLRIGEFFLPNIDSIGDFSRFMPEDRFRCWISFCAMSGANIEYGGQLEKETKQYGTKTVEAFNMIPIGQMPKPLDFPEPLNGNPAPTLWLNKNKHKTYLAICNWHEDQPSQPMKISAAELGFESFTDVICTEFWSGDTIPVKGKTMTIAKLAKTDGKIYIFSQK